MSHYIDMLKNDIQSLENERYSLRLYLFSSVFVNIVLITIICFLLISNNQKTEPNISNKLTLKGITVGNIYTERNLVEAFKISCEKTSSGESIGCKNWVCNNIDGFKNCSGNINLGDIEAFMVAKLSSQSELLSMSFNFHSNDFKDIEPILIEKFGKPKTKKSIVTTRLDMNYDQIEHTWESGEIQASLKKYDSTIDKSILSIYNPILEKKYTKHKVTVKDLD